MMTTRRQRNEFALRTLLLVTALGSALAIDGCALFEEVGKARCASGERQPCTCDDGTAGSQLCASNRTSWEACVCPAAGDGGSGDGGATDRAATDRSASDSSAGDGASGDAATSDSAAGDRSSSDGAPGLDSAAGDAAHPDATTATDTALATDAAPATDAAIGNDQTVIRDSAVGVDAFCAETDQAFCLSNGAYCGNLSAVDSCGFLRSNVDCGGCGTHGACSSNRCNCFNDWAGDRCDRCEPGRWGALCDHDCTCVNGTCNDGTSGDGHCISNSCTGHWAGDDCNQCATGWWGSLCNNACTCVNGTCSDGFAGTGHCIPGTCSGTWRGIDCTIDCSSGFCDLGDGTVLVTDGTLVFVKCSQGQLDPSCSGTADWLMYCDIYNDPDNPCDNGSTLDGSGTTSGVWSSCEALNTVPAGGYAGHTGWRAPTLTELQKLYTAYDGNRALLPNTVQGHYWSSSSWNATNAWAVNFAAGGGTAYMPKDDAKPVRCVRPGP
jgi:hypothetical protein